jgi:hypothetical protein
MKAKADRPAQPLAEVPAGAHGEHTAHLQTQVARAVGD